MMTENTYESHREKFDKRLLIHQNLCLSSCLTGLRHQLTQAHQQIKQLRQTQKDTGNAGKEQTLKATIDELTQENFLLKQRLTLLNNYRSTPMQQVIEREQHLCYCGGLPINYYQDKIEELLALQRQETQARLSASVIQTVPLQTDRTEGIDDNARNVELVKENKELMQQLEKSEKKVEHCQLTHHYNLDYILRSPIYAQLKLSCKNLLLFTSTTIGKQSYMFQKYQDRDRNRQAKVQALYEKLKAPLASIKPEEIILKSKSYTLLQQIKGQHQEMNSKIDGLCAKVRSFNRRYSKMGKMSDSLNKIEPNSFEEAQVSIMLEMHTLVNKWIAHSSFKECLEHNSIKEKHVERLWKKYKDLVRVMFDDNLDLRKQVLCLHQKLMKGEITIEVNQQFSNMIQSIKDLQKRYQQAEKSIMDAEFRATAVLAQQHFKYLRQSLRRQQIEMTLFHLQRKLPHCRKVVEQSVNLTAMIEQQRLDSKQREGEQTGRLDALTFQLAQKDKIIQIQRKNHQMGLQDSCRLAKEADRLKGLLQRPIKQQQQPSIVQQSLQQQVEALYKKLTCLCGRGRQADRVLSSCGHIFCRDCVENTLLKGRKRDCPICRAKFSVSEVIKFMFN